nr:EAL domain-containing protein [Sulfobacillus harzensis]
MLRTSAQGTVRLADVFIVALTASALGTLTGWIKRLERERRSYLASRGELNQSLKQVEYLALHDALTGLANRRLVTARLEEAMRQGRALAVAFVDLDRFKSVNDSRGHGFGDRLLKAVSQTVARMLEPGDLLGRQGGDEFIIVLDQARDVHQTLEAVRRRLEEGIAVDGHRIFSSASFGVAWYPRDGQTADELLRRADAALYRAKEAGRNRIAFYREDMEQEASTALYLETALRRAVEESEFRLVYQPQVDILTGRLTGMEALLRWPAEQDRLFLPDEFLPEAQKLGLMETIDDWVIQRALADVSTLAWWRQERVTVAVNVSATRLEAPDFPRRLLSWLRAANIQPDRVELEITESTMANNPRLAAERLGEIRRLGVGVAVDDFGIGYSSLSYLQHLPISRIKIDREFVARIEESDAIGRAIVAIAKSLHLQVVAEGVETRQQADTLLRLGCDTAQGWYYQQAVSIDALRLKYLPLDRENPA